MDNRLNFSAPGRAEDHKRAPSGTLKGTALSILLIFFLLSSINPYTVIGNEISFNGPLFLINDQTGAGIELLKELPVELYLRISPYYLISVNDAPMSSIEEKGFTLSQIGRVETGKTLFILTRPSGMALGDPPSAGEVLFRGDDWFLVKAQQDVVSLFGMEGFKSSIIPLRPLPLERPRRSAGLNPGRAVLSDEARLKAASSDTTLLRYLQRLENFQTRYSYTDSVIAAAEWIHDKFVEFGFTDVAYDSFMAQGRWQRNIVATKLGTVNPDKVLIIGGHYDSVTYDPNCDPMEWAPGVDDNGSGTAVTLDMARILAGEELDITLKFVPFAAEEQGLYGSWHFAEQAFNSGMDIQLMFNMDMIANLDDTYLDVDINSDNQSRPYAELMSQVAEDSTDLIPFIRNSGGGSDHYPFMQYGYNHVYAEEGDFSPNWHRCTDTIENIDIPYLVQVENMILPTIVIVANSKQIDVEIDCPLDSIPQGGSLPFTASVMNETDSTITFETTLWIKLETGQEIPFFGPSTMTLQAGQGITRNPSINVPDNAHPGDYTVSLVAESLTGDLLDEDSFSVRVMGSNMAGVTGKDGFVLEGW